MCKPLLASINSPRLCGHSVGLVCNCDSRVVYSLFLYHQKNLGGPGSSRGTLERIRAGLTVYRIVRIAEKNFNVGYTVENIGNVGRDGSKSYMRITFSFMTKQ